MVFTMKILEPIKVPLSIMASLTDVVKIECVGGYVTFTATDFDTILEYRAPHDLDFLSTMFLKISGILPFTESSSVTLTEVKSSVNVTTSDGMAGTVNKTLTSFEDFVEFPSETETYESQDAYNLKALQWVAKAASTDKDRPNMNGVCFKNNKVYATDSHRLHWSTFDVLLAKDETCVISLEGIKTLLKVAKKAPKDDNDIQFSWNDQGLAVSVGTRWRIWLKRQNVNFPPVEKVIPKDWNDFEAKVVAKRKELHAAIRKLKLKKKDAAVEIGFGGCLGGITREDETISVPLKIDDLVGGCARKMNGLYLRDAIDGNENQIFFLGKHQICIEHEIGRAVVMGRRD